MATEEVKLLSAWASSFAMRARLALEAKGVKYEVVEENLGDKSKLLLESNPVYKKIPVLLHNGKAIPESLIIVLYVDETWPEDGDRPGFLPKDPFDRATQHFWAAYVDKKIMESAVSALRAKGVGKDAAVKEVYDNLLTLESGFVKLGADPFLNGKSIGYADIALAPLASWLGVFVKLGGIKVPSEEEAPHLHKFLHAIRQHPAAKVALPEEENVLAFARTFLAPILGLE